MLSKSITGVIWAVNLILQNSSTWVSACMGMGNLWLAKEVLYTHLSEENAIQNVPVAETRSRIFNDDEEENDPCDDEIHDSTNSQLLHDDQQRNQETYI